MTDAGKNLVLCCDGTNNSPTGNTTNVLKISQLAEIGDRREQIVYYDPGVGVEPDKRMKTGIGAKFSRWFGSAFGSGLVTNVEQAYAHLIDHFEPGDRIYLFGFSRGAYTVRVLAGLLYSYHLLTKDRAHLTPSVVKAYRDLFPAHGAGYVEGRPTTAQQARLDEAQRYRASGVDAPIHFMGLFDTVSSLGWAYDPKTFSNTRRMPSVQRLRHALALDERRAKFRTNRIDLVPGADHCELWFAGVHCDVGGGYAAPNNRLSRVPLRWMLGEARKAGMRVNAAVEQAMGLDVPSPDDEQAPQNESLDSFWKGLEILPLPHWDKVGDDWVESRRVYRSRGWREIPDTYVAHDSLRRRKVPVKNIHWSEALAKMTFRP